MRLLGSALLLCVVMVAGASHADPAAPATRRQITLQDVDRLRFGITSAWMTRRFGGHLGLGVGWTLPQRWYDTDGQLLTERSLLNPGDDLERSGLYFALRF